MRADPQSNRRCGKPLTMVVANCIYPVVDAVGIDPVRGRAQSSAQLKGSTSSPGIQRQDLPSITGSVNSHGSVTTNS